MDNSRELSPNMPNDKSPYTKLSWQFNCSQKHEKTLFVTDMVQYIKDLRCY